MGDQGRVWLSPQPMRDALTHGALIRQAKTPPVEWMTSVFAHVHVCHAYTIKLVNSLRYLVCLDRELPKVVVNAGCDPFHHGTHMPTHALGMCR